MEAGAAMEPQMTDGTPAGESRGRSGLRMRGLDVGRFLPRSAKVRRFELRRFSWRRPELSRPSLPDAVFVAGAACLVAAIVVVVAAPAAGRLRAQTRAAAVLDNAATVQLAAESFAAAHAGRYPTEAGELLPYLPRRKAPRNPYTGRAMTFSGGVGDVTYRSPTAGRDYVIEAWGTGDARPGLLATLRGTATEPGE